MNHIDKRNEALANTLIRNLKRRHIQAVYCPTSKEAVQTLIDMLPNKAVITWGGSATIRDIGVPQALRDNGSFIIKDRELASSPEEAQDIYRQAFHADVYLSSANAISQDGVIVNIDGNGNRVAAITFGPKQVIFLIGINKICQDVDSAIKRARATASPINAARFSINTPCQTDGICHNCNSTDSICNYIHLLRNSPRDRHKVILIGEDLGY